MDTTEYQSTAASFATGGGRTVAYALLGLIEEVGELVDKIQMIVPTFCRDKGIGDTESVFDDMALLGARASKVAKKIRKEYYSIPDGDRKYLDLFFIADGADKEVGDCMWMLSQLCTNLKWNLGDIMNDNICKLTDRQSRGVIVGEGDNR